MARDAQQFTWAGDADQKIEVAPLVHNPESPIQPDAVIAFRGFATLDGAGAGDTADCRITLPLPGNWIYQLNSFQAAYESTARNYNQAMLELYYAAQPGAFNGQTTQLNYGCMVGFAYDLANAGTVTCPIVPTPREQASDSPVFQDKGASPFRNFIVGSDIGGTDPVLWLSSGAGTNPAGGTLRMAVTFARYSLQQFISAGLYTGLHER